MYDDITYEKDGGLTTVTINRPDKLNAVRQHTVEELIRAFQDAWGDRTIGVLIFTGAGDRAFCVGGDQSAKDPGGGYTGNARSDLGIDMGDLHTLIRDIPKPVIAAVNGYAMDFAFTEEQEQYATELARFAEKRLAPGVRPLGPGRAVAQGAAPPGAGRARHHRVARARGVRRDRGLLRDAGGGHRGAGPGGLQLLALRPALRHRRRSPERLWL